MDQTCPGERGGWKIEERKGCGTSVSCMSWRKLAGCGGWLAMWAKRPTGWPMEKLEVRGADVMAASLVSRPRQKPPNSRKQGSGRDTGGATQSVCSTSKSGMEPRVLPSSTLAGLRRNSGPACTCTSRRWKAHSTRVAETRCSNNRCKTTNPVWKPFLGGSESLIYPYHEARRLLACRVSLSTKFLKFFYLSQSSFTYLQCSTGS